MDNAAATYLDSRVKKETTMALKYYSNPSSFNNLGRKVRELVEKSRLEVARFLKARPEEIIFTSSGSEANNTVILGLPFDGKKGKELIITPIEHPSILESANTLKGKISVGLAKVNEVGLVDLADLKDRLNSKTYLVSIMYANNEIGTIEPILEVAKLIENFRRRNNSRHPLLHTDACQAAEYLDMDVNHLGVDLLTFNGSKIYGPRGVGVLYRRRGIKIIPLIFGGSQEMGLRAGTENVPGIVGLAKAVSLINRKRQAARVSELRDYFISKVKSIPDTRLNGPEGNTRLPNNINISIKNLDSESLLLELDKYGIYAGSGSACTSRSVEPSHVLKAIGVAPSYIRGALRFSLGRKTTKKDIDYLLKILPKIITDLKKRYKN